MSTLGFKSPVDNPNRWVARQRSSLAQYLGQLGDIRRDRRASTRYRISFLPF
jgi:hypothetical protein